MPRLAAAIKSEAIIVPINAAIKVGNGFNPSRYAAIHPVQTPVPGKGIPINKVSPTNFRSSIILLFFFGGVFLFSGWELSPMNL